MGEFADCCAICWSEQSSTHRRCWYATVVLSHRAITKSWMSGARWLTARPIIWKRLEVRERERTGLDTLKVGFNAVHGYYIQISRGQSHLAPINYMRRQTLKNAERYIIPELKEYEDKVLTSKGKALALEKQLYEELFDLLLPHLEALQQSASALANSTCW
ncbi:hypothetical protein ACVXHB_23410 [Escherichia coli]